VVLFLCVHRAGRSQMALGWLKHLADEQAVAWSGGSKPTREVNPAAVAAMTEVGIDIFDEFLKPWTDEVVRAADVVLTIGCGDACPISPARPTRTGISGTPPTYSSRQPGPYMSPDRRNGCGLVGELNVPPLKIASP
jgi:arsenate reductase